MKNIWIFNHYIAPPSIEVGHRHNKFAKYLVKYGYNVNLFFSSVKHNSTVNLIENDEKYKIEESDEGTYIAIKTRQYIGNGKDRILNMLDYFFRLFSVTKKLDNILGKPDIIYASSVHPLTCVAGILIAKRYRVKCIVEIRDLWPLTLVEMGMLRANSIITKLLYEGEKWIYKKADSIIFTMEGGKQYIIDRGWENKINFSKIYYINNGVDLEVFNKLKNQKEYIDEELENNTEIFKVIYTGSIRPANGVKNIIEVAEILSKKEEYKRIKFYIFGDGSEKKILENYCICNDIKNVIFKGNIKKEYIPYILSFSNLNMFNDIKADNLFKYGISQNKLFDYFASCKPIISNVDCRYNIVENYNAGIVIKNNSKQDFVNAIIKFYELDEYTYDIYCRNSKNASEDFDFKNLTLKLEKAIQETIGK